MSSEERSKIKRIVKDTSRTNHGTQESNLFLRKSNYTNHEIIWWLSLTLVFTVSFGTRLYKISEPDHVCWDETHFGKMGSWYINHTFFFDVHPPLGKMLIGLSGHLTGYNGTFAFNKPGDKYEDYPYVGMRVFCAILGTCVAPFAFLSVRYMTESLAASLLTASFLIFDIGLITLSQYILLDPILLFFVFGSLFGFVRFETESKCPFSAKWWFWLIWTGTFLACSVSVKFVGLFVVILIGFKTISQLWDILGDTNISMYIVLKHFLCRALCLIILPIAVYMLFFWIHYKVLYKSGSGDGFFSSAFQSQLEGNSLYNASMPHIVAYGAIITLKNDRTGGGYLHSHWHLYPEDVGAKQQQVTTYSHKDDNNRWIIKRYDRESNPDSGPIEIIKNGDLIRLEHVVTQRNLHSHREIAPVTKKHYQVSCYGDNGTGDANDVWKIEILGGRDKEEIKTVVSRLKLTHYLVGCALHSHSKQLPKWGYEQMEVSCNPNLIDKNNYWNIEDNYFPRLPNVSFEVYAPTFLEKFFESHAVMFQGNSGLKPKEGEVTSRPWQWPINYRGQFFSGSRYRIYLLGNPIIWWGNILLMAIYLIVQITISTRKQRGCEDSKLIQENNQRLTLASSWLFVGWILHYIPFYFMGRVLYFHHYFPAVIFSSMLSAVVLDYLISTAALMVPNKFSNTIYHWSFGVIFSSIIYSFYLFMPLSYGMEGPTSVEQNSTLAGLKWIESWEF